MQPLLIRIVQPPLTGCVQPLLTGCVLPLLTGYVQPLLMGYVRLALVAVDKPLAVQWSVEQKYRSRLLAGTSEAAPMALDIPTLR